jgi:hypothetical protein
LRDAGDGERIIAFKGAEAAFTPAVVYFGPEEDATAFAGIGPLPVEVVKPPPVRPGQPPAYSARAAAFGSAVNGMAAGGGRLPPTPAGRLHTEEGVENAIVEPAEPELWQSIANFFRSYQLAGTGRRN